MIEDTPVDLAALREEMGPTVASLVEGVTKMEVIDDYAGARGATTSASRSSG